MKIKWLKDKGIRMLIVQLFNVELTFMVELV